MSQSLTYNSVNLSFMFWHRVLAPLIGSSSQVRLVPGTATEDESDMKRYGGSVHRSLE